MFEFVSESEIPVRKHSIPVDVNDNDDSVHALSYFNHLIISVLYS